MVTHQVIDGVLEGFHQFLICATFAVVVGALALMAQLWRDHRPHQRH